MVLYTSIGKYYLKAVVPVSSNNPASNNFQKFLYHIMNYNEFIDLTKYVQSCQTICRLQRYKN